MFGMLFLLLTTSLGRFLSTDFAFWITDWTCCHGPYLHAILRIISRSVSGLATDSPCGVWGRGWTTCLLHDSPLFGSHFKMRVGMWVWSDISYIYYFLPLFTVSRTKPVIFFYSVITFSYIKCFVHSYTVDVVFTLSYCAWWDMLLNWLHVACPGIGVVSSTVTPKKCDINFSL